MEIDKSAMRNEIEEDSNPTPMGVCAICSKDMILKKESMIFIREKYLCAVCSFALYLFLEDFFKKSNYELIFDEKELEKCAVGVMKISI